MKTKSYLIKYGEIGLKGDNRYLFEDALAKQVRIALKKIEGRFHVTRSGSRIYAEALTDFDEEEAVGALQKVFGVLWICPVVRVEENGYDQLERDVIDYFGLAYPDKHLTFKVESKRGVKTFPVVSQEMNRRLGEALLTAYPELKVDVHHPDVLLHVEVRDGYVDLYSKEIPGPGGMPLGSAGKAMLLLSGGIDSPVAGYMVSRRGVYIDAVYFHAPPYTTDRAKEKVVDLAKQMAKYTGPIHLHVINFTDIQLMIYETCPHDELTVIMRRYMMRIAETIARIQNCQALVTGESIGQVASQTMHALACTDDAATLPVFRPVISFDKQEIIDIAQKIGTFETSILPYEDCCTIFVAKHPVTKPEIATIEASEALLVGKIEPLVEEALRSDQVIICTDKRL